MRLKYCMKSISFSQSKDMLPTWKIMAFSSGIFALILLIVSAIVNSEKAFFVKNYHESP